MRGEAFKRYYLANKEAILQANRERAQKMRELRQTDEEERNKHLAKMREKESKWRNTHYKATFEELSLHSPEKWKPFFKLLSEATTLHQITPTMFQFLASIHRDDALEAHQQMRMDN